MTKKPKTPATTQTSHPKAFLWFVIPPLLLIGIIGIGSWLLGYKRYTEIILDVSFYIAGVVLVVSLALIILRILLRKFLGPKWLEDPKKIALATALIGLVAALVPAVSQLQQRPATAADLERTYEYKVDEAKAIATTILGQWMGEYVWTDFKTGKKIVAREVVVFDKFDSETGRILGRSGDTEGQETAIIGEVVRNRVLFYYKSKKINRDSFGSAVLILDNKDGKTMSGLVIIHELDQKKLMAGAYSLKKISGSAR